MNKQIYLITATPLNEIIPLHIIDILPKENIINVSETPEFKINLQLATIVIIVNQNTVDKINETLLKYPDLQLNCRFCLFDHCKTIQKLNIVQTDIVWSNINSSSIWHSILNSKGNFTDKLNKHFIFFGKHDKQELIEISAIRVIEAKGAYSMIYCENQAPTIVSKPLMYFSKLLENEIYFVKINRSIWVNIQKIRTVFKEGIKYFIQFTDKTVFEISNYGRKELLIAMKNHKQVIS